jgi:N6-adenosine-specific RNA methylase IME4
MDTLWSYFGVNWPFGDLEPGSYDFIMADPPWDFSNWSSKGERKNAKAHYRCLPIAEIKAFPVAELAAPNTLLWMWATNPMLDQQIDTLKAWGFDFKTAGTWVKTTVHGKIAFGTGYIFRSSSEPVLIGTRGSPKTSRSVRSVLFGPVREHSRKPEEAFVAAEKLMPKARRVELFSRTDRSGWDTWGDEVGKFEGAVA